MNYKSVVLLFVQASALLANEPGGACPNPHAHSSVEVKAGYFFFTDTPMKTVYDQSGVDIQITGTYPVLSGKLYETAPADIRLYGSIEYIYKSGHSIGLHQKTSITEIPLSVGLQPIFLICCKPEIRYYATIGPRYIHAFVDNHSNYVPRNMTANTLGMFVNTGFTFNYNHFLFNIFGEYSYAKVRFNPHASGTYTKRTQIGGVSVGAGVGYSL